MPVITLRTAEVIEKIEARRAVIIAEFEAATELARKVLADREAGATSTEDWAVYHSDIAAGLRNRDFEYVNGRLRKVGNESLPTKPNSAGYRRSRYRKSTESEPFEWYDDTQIKHYIEVDYPKAQAEDVAPLDVALDLYRSTTDETVEVDTEHLMKLLAPKYRRMY